MESKTENSTHSFRETSLVLQLIKETHISKTVKSLSTQKKKESLFCNVYFVQIKFF